MNIYLIAGPPGIGKSTNARAFIPLAVPIIDQDLAAYQYKKEGFSNYQDIASMSTRQQIRRSLLPVTTSRWNSTSVSLLTTST